MHSRFITKSIINQTLHLSKGFVSRTITLIEFITVKKHTKNSRQFGTQSPTIYLFTFLESGLQPNFSKRPIL